MAKEIHITKLLAVGNDSIAFCRYKSIKLEVIDILAALLLQSIWAGLTDMSILMGVHQI